MFGKVDAVVDEVSLQYISHRQRRFVTLLVNRRAF